MTFEERHGITRREVLAYEGRHGVAGVLSMYRTQRANARERGIAWEMSLREWIEVWGAKIGQRGQGKDKLMMCRADDKGPYRKDNVRLATSHENKADQLTRHRLAGWGKAKYRNFKHHNKGY